MTVSCGSHVRKQNPTSGVHTCRNREGRGVRCSRWHPRPRRGGRGAATPPPGPVCSPVTPEHRVLVYRHLAKLERSGTAQAVGKEIASGRNLQHPPPRHRSRHASHGTSEGLGFSAARRGDTSVHLQRVKEGERHWGLACPPCCSTTPVPASSVGKWERRVTCLAGSRGPGETSHGN